MGSPFLFFFVIFIKKKSVLPTNIHSFIGQMPLKKKFQWKTPLLYTEKILKTHIISMIVY